MHRAGRIINGQILIKHGLGFVMHPILATQMRQPPERLKYQFGMV